MPGPLIPGVGPFSASDFLRFLGKTSPRYMGRDLGVEQSYSRPRALPMDEPYSYDQLLEQMKTLPVRMGGDLENPSAIGNIPLSEGLQLLLEGSRGRGMATLEGKF
jgi:hypothetical protein